MTQQTISLSVETWSHGGQTSQDPLLAKMQSDDRRLNFVPNGRFYRATVLAPAAGMLVMQMTSPRPIRISADGILVFDHALSWRIFQRQIVGAIAIPVQAGKLELSVEVGPRPRHPEHIDHDCPSRNRDRVMRETQARFADRLDLKLELHTGVAAPAMSMRFEPTQYREEGVVYQHVLVQDLQGRFAPPTTEHVYPPRAKVSALHFATNVLPGTGREITQEIDRQAGMRRFAVPVAEPQNMPEPLRAEGPDARPEPIVEIARWLELRIDSPVGGISVPLPGYESLGRNAPRKEYRELTWPKREELLAGVPEVVLPASLAHYVDIYRGAWDMFLQLLRFPKRESGVINSYVSTGANFGLYQFVWDSSFTTIAASYGWRVLPVYAQLDNLYSRQFDGGYIHREHDWHDGLPHLYEPDFSPNPPIMTIAEWQIARLNGNKLRLRQVYPVLKANHRWLWHNRRLADGTFWTTGLANGLDNSPSLGDGYPDLSAQMAHEAEVLANIARLIGLEDEAKELEAERQEIAAAINAKLWSESMRIYSTSLPNGGHNPNKVVTAFWPLWAGVVPPERVEALAQHLLDPKSFWRHHPIPSLAADSPHFQPAGNYWLGSTWAPTNYATIKGFARSGRHDLALKATLRHLDCMHEVWKATGQIWENYCSEASTRGSWSGSPYCWSALGPIALLIEVVIGIEADALANKITWTLPEQDSIGIRRLALGDNTVSLVQRISGNGRQIEVSAELPFTLEMRVNGKMKAIQCPAGNSSHAVG